MPTVTDDTTAAREKELWDELEPKLRDQFGENADIRATLAGDHIDVRILPTELDEDFDADLDIVPYNAFRMTIRPDS